MHADTKRLDFLLRFMSIEDVGDEESVPGVVVQGENMEHELGVAGVTGWDDGIRDIIDRAIQIVRPRHGCERKVGGCEMLICPGCGSEVTVEPMEFYKCYPCPECHRMVHKAMWLQFNEEGGSRTATEDTGN